MLTDTIFKAEHATFFVRQIIGWVWREYRFSFWELLFETCSANIHVQYHSDAPYGVTTSFRFGQFRRILLGNLYSIGAELLIRNLNCHKCYFMFWP